RLGWNAHKGARPAVAGRVGEFSHSAIRRSDLRRSAEDGGLDRAGDADGDRERARLADTIHDHALAVLTNIAKRPLLPVRPVAPTVAGDSERCFAVSHAYASLANQTRSLAALGRLRRNSKISLHRYGNRTV